MDPQRKRVLVAPLEWGLGHATRCVPVINELLRQKAEVILAADGGPYDFLAQEFPQLKLIRLPGYGITYPQGGGLALHLLMHSPLITHRIREERRQIAKIVETHKIDIIISDNRFACLSKQTRNVYITHQLMVKSILPKLTTNLHRRYYDEFDELWIPDYEGNKNLSGELSHNDERETWMHYVGPLSRFSHASSWTQRPYAWWLVVLLSGPEPQRTNFEKLILEELPKFTEETLIVRGLPGKTKLPKTRLPHVHFVNHLPDAELQEALLSTHHVLCRPGYSSLCDLSTLDLCPIVVPTPGQPEQEYLAKLHAGMGHVVNVSQKKFNLSEAIRLHSRLRPFGVHPIPQLLAERVKRLLARSKKEITVIA
ncbi:MAG TPA: glycosyltransferase [Bacteroidia bacterium]|nr:glycosyltransferase [Bacteroidia bacterium]